MNRTTIIALVLALAATGGLGCKSNSANTDSDEEQAQSEQGPKTDKTDKAKMELPIETTEPDEMVEDIDLEERHFRKHRVILFFAPNPGHPDYREMAAEVADSTDGIEERDLVVYHMFWERPGLVGDQGIPVEVAQKLRRQHAVLEDAFTYILIGKDGTQKMRAEEAVPLATVFDEIDSMPMRKREMKQAESQQAESQESEPAEAEAGESEQEEPVEPEEKDE